MIMGQRPFSQFTVFILNCQTLKEQGYSQSVYILKVIAHKTNNKKFKQYEINLNKKIFYYKHFLTISDAFYYAPHHFFINGLCTV